MRICRELRWSVRTVHQSGVKELGRVSVMHLVEVSPVSVLVVDGYLFHAGSARTDANTAILFAVDTLRNHVHFVRAVCNLPDGIRYLLDLKPGLL